MHEKLRWITMDFSVNKMYRWMNDDALNVVGALHLSI